MTTLLALTLSTAGLLGALFWVAIAVVVIGAIVALVRYCGVTIPQPVIIVFWALLAIAMIILLFRLFGVIV